MKDINKLDIFSKTLNSTRSFDEWSDFLMSDPISLNLKKKTLALEVLKLNLTTIQRSPVTGEAPEKLDPDFSLQDTCQMKIG